MNTLPTKRVLFVVRVVALATALLLNSASQAAQNDVVGSWQWKGDLGWQRVRIDLKADKGELRGTVWMGPGPASSPYPEDFWEYFFNPVPFEITKGTIRNNTFTFEHKAYGQVLEAYEFRMVYEGRIEGNRMFLSRESVGTNLIPAFLKRHRFNLVLERRQ